MEKKRIGCKKKKEIRNLKLKFTILYFLLIKSFISFAQTGANITIKLENVKLSDILQEIKVQSGKSLLYSNTKVDKYQNESINIKNASLDKALKECLKNKGIKYRIVDNVIIIEENEKSENKNPKELVQVIRGQIIDRESKSPLPGANIVILNSDPLIGTISDLNGYFKIENVPVGRHTIRASFVGYEEIAIPEILIGSAKEFILNIELSESVTLLDEIVFKAAKWKTKNEMAAISSRSFSVEETKRYAASVSDPARMALVFAGTACGDDLTNELIVRGNSPNYLQYRMEGIEIPNPNHFAEDGSSSGAISVLSAYVLDKSDFLTGAFPAEYGNVLSGVFDLYLRNGNYNKREYSFQAGVLGLDFAVEGPFSKKYNGSYLMNYRYSTLAILNAMNFFVGDDIPKYQNLSFKLYLPSKKIGSFSIWGIGGMDKSIDPEILDSTKWESNLDRFVTRGYNHMMATGITHTIFPDNKTYIKSIIAYTQNGTDADEDSIDNNYEIQNIQKLKYRNTAIKTSFLINRKFNSRITARTGLKVNFLSNEHSNNIYEMPENHWREYVKGDNSTELYHSYLQLKYRINDKLVFMPGLHYMHFSQTKESILEPRASIKWQLKPKQSLGFAIGKHSRHETIGIYYIKFYNEDNTYSYLNSNIKLVKGWHYVLSYDINIKDNLYFKAEAYCQNLYDTPITRDTTQTMSLIGNDPDKDFSYVSKGNGRNYGLELTLEKSFTNNYYFLLTSSIFESQYRAANKKWYNTVYNYKYIFNLVGGKEYYVGRSKNNILGFNGKFIWTGGRRDTPLKEQETIESDEEVYILDKINSIKYKDYMRMDIGINYKINKPKTSHNISLDIQNVTNRMNLEGRNWDSENGEFVYDYLTGLLPILSYKIEF